MTEEDFQQKMLSGMGKLTTEQAVTGAKMEATKEYVEGIHDTLKDIREAGTKQCAVNAEAIKGTKERVTALEGDKRSSNRRAIAWGGGGLLGGGTIIMGLAKLYESWKGGGQ